MELVDRRVYVLAVRVEQRVRQPQGPAAAEDTFPVGNEPQYVAATIAGGSAST
jgi:hypothetical protein